MPLIVLSDRTGPSVSHRARAHPSLVTLSPTSNQSGARYARLLKLCRARGCTREDARELVQEGYLRLFQYLRFTKVRDEDSLLRRIIINLSINHYHRELSTPFVFERIDDLDRRSGLIDPKAGPERTLAAQQHLDRVASLLSAVSPRTCQIFIAQRGGYSYEEIGVGFAIKPRTVEKHVVTATSMLMEIGYRTGFDVLGEEI